MSTEFTLTVIGSGTVAPSAGRSGPSHWVTAGTAKVLLDCGHGSLRRAVELGVPWHEVTHAIVSHFHVDHWGELPTLLFALRWGIEPAREAPLDLIGPPGFKTRMTLLAAALGDWVLDPGYPLRIAELQPGASDEIAPGVLLEACKTPHTLHSQAYAIRYGTARMVYTGDTGPSPELADWASDCDLLLAECSLPDDRAIAVHLSPTAAGELGRAARARRLVLTHFYPVFGESDPAAAAAAAFGRSVHTANDGDRFQIGTGT